MLPQDNPEIQNILRFLGETGNEIKKIDGNMVSGLKPIGSNFVQLAQNIVREAVNSNPQITPPSLPPQQTYNPLPVQQQMPPHIAPSNMPIPKIDSDQFEFNFDESATATKIYSLLNDLKYDMMEIKKILKEMQPQSGEKKTR
tara:strand:- start:914 stop:1342 length:429 start_codon:yes stop_codon:yes gene_type:complete